MRIFVDPAVLLAGELEVTGDEHHYLSRSRRARPGDAVELVDGAGRRAAATIVRITDTATWLDVAIPEAIPAQLPFVRSLLPLIKGERMDYALEKLVEVGVDEIVLWPAARAVVRLDADRRAARLAKYTAALQAAARQSGRAQVPAIRYAESLGDAIGRLPEGARFVLDPSSDESFGELAALDVTIASGPEGGLAREELDVLARAGFVSIGLGPRILRAETAPVVAVSRCKQ